MIKKEQLKRKPFYLNEQEIAWVEDTLSQMTEEEKVGQLFFLTGYTNDKEYLTHISRDLQVGGMMCRAMSAQDVVSSVTQLQQNSKTPMLIAANLEAGGNGIVQEGTKIGAQMAVAATGDTQYAYELGSICAQQAKSVGANYAFAPVIDIDFNFRNPITNTRTYGSDPDTVLAMGQAYLKGCQENGIIASIKHFPGDGVDERDQHLLTSVNSLSCEEWDKTYGKIYKTLIEDGAKTVMAGHIMQPAYSRALCPGIKDRDILPASLSKELLCGLLREKLGFQGLIISDATTMTGMTAAMPRDRAVPYAIAAGCDMFLFAKNLEEDVRFMFDGLKNGILSRERLEEAVTRILALKASMGLHRQNNIPQLTEAMRVLNDPHAQQIAKEVADRSATLVKNVDGIIPLDKAKIKHVLLYGIESGENALGYGRETGLAEQLGALLEKEGMQVTHFKAGERFEGRQASFKEVTEEFDLMLYIANLATKSNQTTVRIEWMNPMGVNCPIYTHTVPTVFISVENPYHLLDVPHIKTFINCYSCNQYTLPLLVDKLFGRSKFTGSSPVDPFCGKWDTAL
ncbi:MAG: beta-N-acetylhexosaminidase [Clostridiales bacterium]|jgi:beta-N-acetylhexosaminidase|nr:beta-N-acetylhexosaminidase [Clostridiales bacterium]